MKRIPQRITSLAAAVLLSACTGGGDGEGADPGAGSTPSRVDIRALSTGSTTTVVTADGNLWAWGANVRGSLADGTVTVQSVPTLIGSGYLPTDGSVSGNSAIKSDYSVWMLGGSSAFAAGFARVVVGDRSTGTGFMTDGSLWGWGRNEFGQLGLVSQSTCSAPFLLTIPCSPVPERVGEGYSTVAVGSEHTLAIKGDGTLWSWGRNNVGQLGAESTDQCLSGVVQAPVHSNCSKTPIQVGTGFVAVAAGESHTVALKADGSLWTWGGNSSGQLGDGTSNSQDRPMQIGMGYKAVAAGRNFTLALKTDGSIWAWGSNADGQIGIGTTGQSKYTIPTMVATGFRAIAAGESTAAAIREDGSLWLWGQNVYGQVGNGTYVNQSTPARVM